MLDLYFTVFLLVFGACTRTILVLVWIENMKSHTGVGNLGEDTSKPEPRSDQRLEPFWCTPQVYAATQILSVSCIGKIGRVENVVWIGGSFERGGRRSGAADLIKWRAIEPS
jgi:hypothetical protein